MKQTKLPDQVCERCLRFRRLGGYYTAAHERAAQSPEPLIPAKVGLCTIGGAAAVCHSCKVFHEGETVGAIVPCSCGLSVRLEPIRYVLPWGTCRNFLPVKL